MKKIRLVALGANPARQKTLFFDRFLRGEVNRARRMMEFPSGKGINFCRAARSHGVAGAVTVQFAGGDNGRFIENALTAEGLEFRSVRTAAATRCCTTCLDAAEAVMTEVIEPSGAAGADEVDELIRLLEAELTEAAGAAFCGTLPDGTTPELYRRAAGLVLKSGVPLLLDVWKDIGDVLAGDGLKILKINRQEMLHLTGENTVEAAFRVLFRRYRIAFAAVTDGSDRAFAGDGRRLAVYTLPDIGRVVNPIGCGDTASAVLLSELVAGTEKFQAFAAALAAASANALTELPGSFDRSRAAEIRAEIGVKML